MTLKELKKGEYFTLKEVEFPNETQVWVKGSYDRSSKKFSCHRFSNVNDERFFKSNKKIFTDFIF